MPNVTKTYGIGLYLDRAMKDKNRLNRYIGDLLI